MIRNPRKEAKASSTMRQYFAAGPSQYLAIVDGSHVKVAKEAWVWPTQKCICFDLSYVNYNFLLLDRGAEFGSGFFTILPRATDQRSLLLYAKLIASHPHVHVKDLVLGLIRGLVCRVSASMTVGDVCKEVSEELQSKLNQFGLMILQTSLTTSPGAGKTKRYDVIIRLETKGKVGAGHTQQIADTKETGIKVKWTEQIFKNWAMEDVCKGEVLVKLQLKLNQFGHVIHNTHPAISPGAGQTKQCDAKIRVETKPKMKAKVGAGQTKQISVKTEIIATERLKVRIEVKQAVLIFKNWAWWNILSGYFCRICARLWG